MPINIIAIVYIATFKRILHTATVNRNYFVTGQGRNVKKKKIGQRIMFNFKD